MKSVEAGILARIVEAYMSSPDYRVACSALNARANRDDVHKSLSRLAERLAGAEAKTVKLGPFVWIEERGMLIYGPVTRYRGGEEHVYQSTVMVSASRREPGIAETLQGVYRRMLVTALLLPRREPAVVRVSSGSMSEEVEVPPPLQSLLAASLREQYGSCNSLECVDLEELLVRVHGEHVYARLAGILESVDKQAKSGSDAPLVASVTARLASPLGVSYPLDLRLVYTPGGESTIAVITIGPPPESHTALLVSYLLAAGLKPSEKLLDILALKGFEASMLHMSMVPRLRGEEREAERLASYAQCLSFHMLLSLLAGRLAPKSIVADDAAEQLLEEYRSRLLESLVKRATGRG